MGRRRISLDEAGRRLLAFVPGVELARIPASQLAAWDCVVFELRPERVDVMACCCAPRPQLPADGDPLSVTQARSWGLDDRRFPLFWYEWDCPDGVPQPPLESICVSDSILGTTTGAAFGEALAALCDAGDAALWAPSIQRLVQLLGGRGELLHLAPLRPRGVRRLRLTFHVVAQAIIPWLEQAGWPRQARRLAPALFSVAAAGEKLGVQLELAEDGALGEYLGVETREYRSRRGARHWMRPLLQSIRELAPLPRELPLEEWPGEAGDLLHHAYTKLVLHEDAWSAKHYLGMTAPEIASTMRAVEERRSL